MIYKINVSRKFVDYVETIDYEKRSRKNLICFLLQNKRSDKLKLEKLQTEYNEFYIQFELIKQYIQDIYLSAYNNVKTWNLNYITKELIIDGEKK